MVPDYAMIAEIILYSYGYLHAREMARKIVTLYKLCSEQLSKQDHYDYGMRAVMAVLRAAGNLKRSNSDQPEDELTLRAIVDVNEAKFLHTDMQLFRGIVSDLFPNVQLTPTDYNLLYGSIRSVASAKSLQSTDYFLQRCVMLYEMVRVRHGLMLVGQPYSGKSSSYQCLAAAMTKLQNTGQYEAVHTILMNPKALHIDRLYGSYDKVSHEWTDGVLAARFRECATGKIGSPQDRLWVILDGPVDAVWIENMNTVLDDNKKLCLNSGEIIKMSETMSMIFEVADLAVASPATVSRCGMVYYEPHLLGWKTLIASWMNSLPTTRTRGRRLLRAFSSSNIGIADFVGMTESSQVDQNSAEKSESDIKSNEIVINKTQKNAEKPPLQRRRSLDPVPMLLDKMQENLISSMVERLLSPCLIFIRGENYKEQVITQDSDLVVGFCRIFRALIEDYLNGISEKQFESGNRGIPTSVADLTPLQALMQSGGNNMLNAVVESLFVFSLIWSIGVTGNNKRENQEIHTRAKKNVCYKTIH